MAARCQHTSAGAIGERRSTPLQPLHLFECCRNWLILNVSTLSGGSLAAMAMYSS